MKTIHASHIKNPSLIKNIWQLSTRGALNLFYGFEFGSPRLTLWNEILLNCQTTHISNQVVIYSMWETICTDVQPSLTSTTIDRAKHSIMNGWSNLRKQLGKFLKKQGLGSWKMDRCSSQEWIKQN